jgi:hypothetical protein
MLQHSALALFKFKKVTNMFGAGIAQLVKRLATGWMTEGLEFESR